MARRRRRGQLSLPAALKTVDLLRRLYRQQTVARAGAAAVAPVPSADEERPLKADFLEARSQWLARELGAVAAPAGYTHVRAAAAAAAVR